MLPLLSFCFQGRPVQVHNYCLDVLFLRHSVPGYLCCTRDDVSVQCLRTPEESKNTPEESKNTLEESALPPIYMFLSEISESESYVSNIFTATKLASFAVVLSSHVSQDVVVMTL